ncbi:MAG: undecaprenyldiphospho-muramoylpentapeptide beta-N-acetylglucosaminyltransferase [Saprospiraceae bacterium]
MKIIISGGGTGGHIFPALAIADHIKMLQPAAEILFVGAIGKMEMERVPKAGYPIIGLPVVGFQRRMTIKNIRHNLLFPFKLLDSLLKARKIISDFRPDVVVGVGGYASGPILRVAMSMGIPGIIQEQNSYAGVTNKLLAQKAKKICVAYEEMDRFFPKEKIVNLGNPVRNDIWQNAISAEEGRKFYGLDANKKTIVVIGGSLGAKTLNEAVAHSKVLLQNQPEVQVLWQCGKLYYDLLSTTEVAGMKNVKLTAFLEKMDMAYAAADVVISRAGALSISEICLVAKPVILVPSPNVSEDHQTHNAMALVNNGAALLVKDSSAKEEMIQTTLDLLFDPVKKKALTENIARLAKPKAADDIAKIVIEIGTRKA